MASIGPSKRDIDNRIARQVCNLAQLDEARDERKRIIAELSMSREIRSRLHLPKLRHEVIAIDEKRIKVIQELDSLNAMRMELYGPMTPGFHEENPFHALTTSAVA